MKTTYKCVITVNSPLHIGCDEVYEPMGFVLDEEQKQLIAFDPVSFINSLSPADKSTLSSLCCLGDLPSILRIYKFFQGRKAQGRRVSVAPAFINHYRSTLKIPENKIQQELNKFVIERTAFRTADNRPFIPGSSIKGALRTGYLNHVCGGKNMRERDAKALEKKLLDYQSIEQDPFGHVKVSDFQPAGEIQTRIVYAVNKKKKVSEKEARGPYQILEVIEPGAAFIGEITVGQPAPESPVREPVELKALLSGTHDFYAKEHKRENRELRAVGIPAENYVQKDTLLMRMGRHSGAESVTIAGNRNIMIKKGPKKDYLDHATTLWLTSPSRKDKNIKELQPFGWSGISRLDADLETRLSERENVYAALKAQEEKEQLAEAQLQIQKAAEAQKMMEEKAAREAAEAAEREKKQKELEAMSPQDRELAEIFDENSVNENKVVDLYKRIDEMEDDFKIKSAEKIKAFYISENKWNVNKKKKKQFAKVQHLKSILGES
ncbi:type III-A CRISPR-associated RAMP protein Csm5 [Desulfobacter sp.]